MPFFRPGLLSVSFLTLTAVMTFAKHRDRVKLFEDYCDAGEAPSRILLERLKYHYGEAFANEARRPRPQVREALHKMTTLTYWFDDPVKVLKYYTAKPGIDLSAQN